MVNTLFELASIGIPEVMIDVAAYHELGILIRYSIVSLTSCGLHMIVSYCITIMQRL
jgi:hypothetical protein